MNKPTTKVSRKLTNYKTSYFMSFIFAIIKFLTGTFHSIKTTKYVEF